MRMRMRACMTTRWGKEGKRNQIRRERLIIIRSVEISRKTSRDSATSGSCPVKNPVKNPVKGLLEKREGWGGPPPAAAKARPGFVELACLCRGRSGRRGGLAFARLKEQGLFVEKRFPREERQSNLTSGACAVLPKFQDDDQA